MSKNKIVNAAVKLKQKSDVDDTGQMPTIGDLYPGLLSKIAMSGGASGMGDYEKAGMCGYNEGRLNVPGAGGKEFTKLLSQLIADGTTGTNSDVDTLKAANNCVTAIHIFGMLSGKTRPTGHKSKCVPHGPNRSTLIERYIEEFSNRLHVLGYIPANNTSGLIDGESAYLVDFDGKTPFNLIPGKPFYLERVISYGNGRRSVVGAEKYERGALAAGIKSVLLEKSAKKLTQDVYSEILSGNVPQYFSGAFVLIVRSDKNYGK